MKATRVYADAAGATHFEDLEIPVTDAGRIGRLSADLPVRALVFRETDDTYDFDWHPAPRRQWLALLDGEIEIEVSDGSVRRFRGGDVLFLEDTNGRGHRTRQLNAGVRHSLFIPVP